MVHVQAFLLFAKVGLQGVDNGSIRFTHVRVPRDNLLDRFAVVERGGAYRSPFSPSRRFAATLGELTGGRVGIASASLGALKVPAEPLPCAFTVGYSQCMGASWTPEDPLAPQRCACERDEHD